MRTRSCDKTREAVTEPGDGVEELGSGLGIVLGQEAADDSEEKVEERKSHLRRCIFARARAHVVTQDLPQK
jgi:hypothetical protein